MRKYSYQRELIKTYLLNSSSHPTAEDIYNELKTENKNLSLATVYRNLKLLVEEGVAETVESNDAKEHYDAVCVKHDHFICKNCGKISDLDGESILNGDDYEKLGGGYKITDHKLILYGICPACRAGRPNKFYGGR